MKKFFLSLAQTSAFVMSVFLIVLWFVLVKKYPLSHEPLDLGFIGTLTRSPFEIRFADSIIVFLSLPLFLLWNTRKNWKSLIYGSFLSFVSLCLFASFRSADIGFGKLFIVMGAAGVLYGLALTDEMHYKLEPIIDFLLTGSLLPGAVLGTVYGLYFGLLVMIWSAATILTGCIIAATVHFIRPRVRAVIKRAYAATVYGLGYGASYLWHLFAKKTPPTSP